MQQAVSDIRELIYGLRHPVLNNSGFNGVIELDVGLQSMRERAEELGGRSHIGHRRDGSTEVVTQLPLCQNGATRGVSMAISILRF